MTEKQPCYKALSEIYDSDSKCPAYNFRLVERERKQYNQV